MVSAHSIVGSSRSKGRRILPVIGLLGLALGLIAFSPLGPANPAPSVRQPRPSAPAARANLVKTYGKLPLSFQANQGQTDPTVKFLARGSGYGLFLTGDEAVLTLARASQKAKGKGQKVKVTGHEARTTDAVLRMKLVGANTRAAVAGAEQLPGKANYFIGNDPQQWRTNVPTYAQVKYQGVYPGVDLVYYGNQSGQLEYDFVVAPGADPAAIHLAVAAMSPSPNGGQRPPLQIAQRPPLQIASNGDLIVPVNDREVRLHKPVVYQTNAAGNRQSAIDNRQSVEGHYILTASNQIQFKVGAYDHTQPLVIDPSLTYSTYLGGAGSDGAYAIAIDSTGAAYVAGQTGSTNFPTKTPYQGTLKGSYNGFVTKLNPAGSALDYSTYIGGNGDDALNGIALDSSLNAVLGGYTTSSNFPVLHPLTGESTFTGGKNDNEAVVTKLSAAGNALIFSTYLGGSGDGFTDTGSLALDSSGDIYVGGETDSSAYPVLHAIQATNTSGYTGTLSRLHFNTTTSTLSLVYSTYWGVGSTASVNSVAADNNGNVYIGGFSRGNVPTKNPIYAYKGGYDGFVSKLNWNGTTLSTVYSTFLGGSEDDSVTALAIDSTGAVYVTGYTGSTNFPTVHPYQDTNISSTGSTAFVAQINPAGTALVYSTYLGGNSFDYGNGIALGSSGDVFVVGETTSTDFPTVNPTQATCGTGSCNYSSDQYNAFVTGLNWNGSELSVFFSTFLGGSGSDSAYGVAATSSDVIYVAGYTTSTNFPTAGTPYQSANKGKGDAFVTKISPGTGPEVGFSAPDLTFATQGLDTTSTAQTVTVTNLGASSLTVSAVDKGGTDPGDFIVTADTCTTAAVAADHTCEVSVTFKPAALGTRTATLTFHDNAADVTQIFDLIGTGASVNPVAVLSPTTLPTFSSVNVGLTSSLSQTVTLSNTGINALAISSIATSANFTQTKTCGTSLAGLSSCYIYVTFKPTTTGTLNGTLTITDNSGGVKGTKQTASLSGTGLAAIAVTITPTTKTLALGATQVFTATISNASNSNLNWYVNGVLNGSTSQGTLTGGGLARTYTAPALNVPIPNPAVIEVQSVEDTTKTKTAAVTVTDAEFAGVCESGNEAILSGQYAFNLTGFNKTGFTAVVGSLTLDGHGNITGGEADTNGGLGLHQGGGVSNSSYSVGADHRGCAKIVTSFGTFNTRFDLGSISSGTATQGTIMEFDPATSSAFVASGQILKQNAANFAGGPSGSYAFLNSGWDSSTHGRIACDGVHTASGGNLTKGEQYCNDAGNIVPTTSITGTYSSRDGHGRFTKTLGSNHLVAYMVSTALTLGLTIDANPILAGEAIQQQLSTFSASSLNGKVAIYWNGLASSTSGSIRFALGHGDGIGIFTYDDFFENDGGAWTENGVSSDCTFTVASNGLVIGSGVKACDGAFYLTAPNTGVAVGHNPTHIYASIITPQTVPSGGFTSASLNGAYFGGTTQIVSQGASAGGMVSALNKGNLSGTGDEAGTAVQQSDQSTTETVTVGSTGTLISSSHPGQVAGLAIDSTHFLIADATGSAYPHINLFGPSTADAVAVKITTPTAAQTVPEKLKLPITASVTGTSNTALTWTVNGVINGNATYGTLTGTYPSYIYTAPATVPSPATFTLTATSNADVSKFASFNVTVSAGVVVKITNPSTATKSLAENATQAFTVTVTGTSTTGITWTVNGATNGNSTYGTITGSGLSVTYKAPAAVPSPATFNVKATSTEDPTKSASVAVTITP